MRELSVHSAAEIEIDSAMRYYKSRVRGLEQDFLAQVEHAFARIEANPDAGPIAGQDARRLVLRRFPYSVIYRVEEHRIRILAVMHQSRRPGYWSRRR